MQEYVPGDSRANLPFGNTICAEVGGPNWEVLWNLPDSFGPEEFGLLEAGHL